MQYGAANSCRLLVHTIQALGPFKDAVTVIGAHAVHVWVEKAWGPTAMETTRDGDIVLNPEFVTDDPKLIDLMAGVGIVPALDDRPGIYGFADEAGLDWQQRTTVDLIVPEAYAGPGRRAARIAGQHHAASRALGLELAVWDRSLTVLATIDEPIESVEAYVAGPAALLTAKSHKVHERLAGVTARPDRQKPKDSGDIALLMMVSDPEVVAGIMVATAGVHPETKSVIANSATWLAEMFGGNTAIPHQHAVDSLSTRFDETEVTVAIDTWLEKFTPSVAMFPN